MKTGRWTTLAAAGVVLMATPAGAAVIHTESPDAGLTLNTAQKVPAGTDTIMGEIESLSDYADLYELDLPATDSMTIEVTVFFFGEGADSVLYLFDPAGAGILGDDDSGVEFLSKITTGPLPAGIYYLGIMEFDSDGPADSAGRVWRPELNSSPPPGFVLDTFSTRFITATTPVYTIELDLGQPAAVPAPAALPLAGLAALGLLGLRRRTMS